MMSNVPYPVLQRYLSRLRELGPERPKRPTFSTLEEALDAAETRSGTTGEAWVATPVWRIEHDDLLDTETVAWAITRHIV